MWVFNPRLLKFKGNLFNIHLNDRSFLQITNLLSFFHAKKKLVENYEH